MRPRAPPFVVRRRRIACLPMVDVRDSLTHSARIRPAPPAGPSPILPPVDHGSMEFRQNARPRAKATSRRPLKTRGKSGMKNDRSFPPLGRRCLPASASRSTHFHFPSVSNVRRPLFTSYSDTFIAHHRSSSGAAFPTFAPRPVAVGRSSRFPLPSLSWLGRVSSP